jgi:hypothetical protein
MRGRSTAGDTLEAEDAEDAMVDEMGGSAAGCFSGIAGGFGLGFLSGKQGRTRRT